MLLVIAVGLIPLQPKSLAPGLPTRLPRPLPLIDLLQIPHQADLALQISHCGEKAPILVAKVFDLESEGPDF
jgi:hypothetical protein